MGAVMVLSASQVGTFSQCSLKWAFRYRLRAKPESRSAALVVGSAVDVAIKTGLNLVKSGAERVEKLDTERLFMEAWDAEVSSDPGVQIDWGRKTKDAHREVALGATRLFLDAEDLPERVARLETLDLRFDLSFLDPDSGCEVEGLRLVGFLDAVERTEHGLRALDFKTAANRAGYDEYSLAVHPGHLQGALYVDALKRLYPDEASDEFALAIALKLKMPVLEERVVSIGPDMRRRALLTVLHAHQAMTWGVAFPQPSFLCGGCPYRKRCSTWQREAVATPRRDIFARTREMATLG